MAQPGRKPKPTGLKTIEGNPGKRPLNKNEPKVEPSIPDPPDFLSEEAAEEWKRIAVLLYRQGILSDFDRGALVAYCQAWGRYEQAERILNEEGLRQVGSTGSYIAHSMVSVANQAAKDVVKYAEQFGMTPSARSRISVIKESGSGWEDF